MDNLSWFKFSPSDWVMGKIQRCPEITQARFIRLVCLYWNKDCFLSVDDAEIEIDKEHLDLLISKKIVKINNGFLVIEFLEEQLNSVKNISNDKKIGGILGNLKRWHSDIYKDYEDKKITLEQAIELSKKTKKTIATQSQPNRNPIATQSQNIADKIREDKIREDKIREDKNKAMPFSFFNELVKLGIDKNLVNDWLRVRKTKKLTNTKTAFNNLKIEFEKRKESPHEIIEKCVTESWGGFKASWDWDKNYNQNINQNGKQPEKPVIGRMSAETLAENLKGWE